MGGLPHTFTRGLVVAALTATPALAGLPDEMWGETGPKLERVVTETDNGARARVRYFTDVYTSVSDTMTLDDGSTETINVHAWVGAFEVMMIDTPDWTRAEAETFARDAVLGVCPSAGAGTVGTATVGGWSTDTLDVFELYVQCPAIDAKEQK